MPVAGVDMSAQACAVKVSSGNSFLSPAIPLGKGMPDQLPTETGAVPMPQWRECKRLFGQTPLKNAGSGGRDDTRESLVRFWQAGARDCPHAEAGQE